MNGNEVAEGKKPLDMRMMKPALKHRNVTVNALKTAVLAMEDITRPCLKKPCPNNLVAVGRVLVAVGSVLVAVGSVLIAAGSSRAAVVRS
jgi:hypothetical protein